MAGKDEDTKLHHGSTDMRGLESTPASSTETGRFGRMFRHIPSAEHKVDFLQRLAGTIVGEGPLDDKAFSDPVPDEEENASIPAGYTYLGQFIDHDITFDPVSSLDRQNDPNALTDFRTPRLDLDSLYGRGPSDEPFMYQKDGTFILGQNGDLPRGREPNQRALIGDPRNDENLIVSQLHGVFLQFHNTMMKAVLNEKRLTGDSAFREAQRRVRWHYQWIVVHDFLPKIVGQETVADILQTRTYKTSPNGEMITITRPEFLFYHYREKPFMPVEFSVAAYRFGHSMVRPSYHLNKHTLDEERNRQPGVRGFRIPIFNPADGNNSLVGFRDYPAEREIDWSFFFNIPGDANQPQPSYKIDATLSAPLADLRGAKVVDKDDPSLAARNLVRGLRLGLPSGQAIARVMGVTPLAEDDFAGIKATPLDGTARKESDTLKSVLTEADFREVSQNTPLWYYVLAEAEVLGKGQQLGPVGARIVAEVLLGLLAADPTSYLGVNPNWKPELGEPFGMPELFNVPGVLPY